MHEKSALQRNCGADLNPKLHFFAILLAHVRYIYYLCSGFKHDKITAFVIFVEYKR